MNLPGHYFHSFLRLERLGHNDCAVIHHPYQDYNNKNTTWQTSSGLTDRIIKYTSSQKTFLDVNSSRTSHLPKASIPPSPRSLWLRRGRRPSSSWISCRRQARTPSRLKYYSDQAWQDSLDSLTDLNNNQEQSKKTIYLVKLHLARPPGRASRQF